jgi:hypothetical protein
MEVGFVDRREGIEFVALILLIRLGVKTLNIQKLLCSTLDHCKS